MPTDIADFDAVRLAAAIHAREVSCAETMQACLARIEALNPAVNAVVALQDPDDLMRQARDADAELAAGRSRGPLHGFPHAVKDLLAVKGIRTTQGSPIFRDFVPDANSLAVERLRAAGVIFVGKTNTPEFGLGSHTFNPVYGVTRNAWDVTKSAGGSSGGAAVALALRMLPLADGSDYGGSLRNPAGWNHVMGFRTSYGRVPTRVREDWLPSMGVAGPMARTVADVALMLSVQAGPDPRVPLAMESPGAPLRDVRPIDPRGKRIAWAGDFGGFTTCDPEVLAVCEGALKTFEALGCVVEPAFPDYPLEAAWEAFRLLRAWQSGSNLVDHYRDPARRALMKPEAVFEVETGLALSAFDVSRWSAVRSEWSQAVRRFFETYDYLVAPTALVFPFDAGQAWPREIAGRPMATYHAWMTGVCLVSLSGCPSLAVPAGFSAAGLPMGLQIVAPVHAEMACLGLGAAYEAASPWIAAARPPLLRAAD